MFHKIHNNKFYLLFLYVECAGNPYRHHPHLIDKGKKHE